MFGGLGFFNRGCDFDRFRGFGCGGGCGGFDGGCGFGGFDRGCGIGRGLGCGFRRNFWRRGGCGC